MSSLVALLSKNKAVPNKTEGAQTFVGTKPLTKQELATWLGVTPRFIETQVAKGNLRRVKLSGHCVRFRPADIEAWLEASTEAEGSAE
jgi:excisionase family DNA binding protein